MSQVPRHHPERLRFLKDEFLTLSLLGALGRSNTYSTSAPDAVKAKLRRTLRDKLNDVAGRYGHPVDEATHLANIQEVAETITSGFSTCLRKGRFRIGIAQKSLNLYLKYLWCLGEIPAPPHCPFDSVIVSRLPKRLYLDWTLIDTIDDYLTLVRAARDQAGESALAEWELREWTRSRLAEGHGDSR